jgi:ATP-binding cassette subfamily B (MDR/TAP) protein 1
MSLFFGKLVQQFVNFTLILGKASAGVPGASDQIPAAAAEFRSSAAGLAIDLVYMGVLHTYKEAALRILTHLLGAGTFVSTFVFMYIWVYTGEVNAKRIRERYLQAVLRQDIAFFDNVGAGEVATRIQTDTRASIIYMHIPSCTYLTIL